MLKRAAATASTLPSTAAEEQEQQEDNVKTPIEYLLETRCRGKLPIARFLPYNVASMLEIRKMSESLIIRHIKQVAYYSESHLRVTPGRRLFLSALTNLRTVVFVAAVATEREQGNVEYTCFHSDVIVPDESNDAFLAAQLAELYARSPASLGVTENGFPFHVLKPMDVLGRGSTSCVFRCNVTTDTTVADTPGRVVAVKVSRLPHAIAMEKWVLQRLASESMQRLPRVDVAFDVQEPFRSCMLVFERIYQPMTCHRWRDNRGLFRDVWTTLEHAHSRGIVHRDVRPANCMWDAAHDCVVVVDWSSASCFGTQHESSSPPPPELRVRGCLSTASDRVINRMQNNNALYEVFPVDEAQSLLYFACFALDEEMEALVAEIKQNLVWNRRIIMRRRFVNLAERIKRLQSLDNESPLIQNEVFSALDAL